MVIVTALRCVYAKIAEQYLVSPHYLAPYSGVPVIMRFIINDVRINESRFGIACTLWLELPLTT